jgi:hypothetical protein
MRSALLAFAAALLCVAVVGCAPAYPEQVPLTPKGEQVELVSDPPSTESYTEVGTIEVAAMGKERADALLQARNALRNQAASRGATLVSVDFLESTLVWERGKTVVRLTGTAYRPHE